MTTLAPRLRHAGRLGVVMVALLLAAVAATMMAARPAAAAPSITADGGPAQVYVSGSGFNSWASVRVVVLTDPGLGSTGASPVYTQANGSGFIGLNVTGLKYSGPVYVLVDSAPFPTVGAITTVQLAPGWISVGQQQCSTFYDVLASAAGFADYYNIRFELLTQDLRVLGKPQYTSSDWIGDAHASLPTTGYSGWAYVVADEYGGGPSGSIPFPYSLWYHVYVC